MFNPSGDARYTYFFDCHSPRASPPAMENDNNDAPKNLPN